MAILRRLGIGVAAVAALAVLTVTIILVITWRGEAPAELVEVTQTPAKPGIGETVRVEALVELPWHRRPTGPPLAELPAGLDRGRDQEPEIVAYGPGSMTWRLQVAVMPVDFGPFEAFTASLPLTPRRDGSDASIEIPVAAIVPEGRFDPDEEGALAFAGTLTAPVPEPEVPPRWPWIVAAVAALALLAFVIVRRRREDAGDAYLPPPPPPWETAQRELQSLEQALPMAADTFFVRLVDLLRQYLEHAFHLPATEQTTVEFLQTMQNAPELLSQQHRALLEEVIMAADIVKFARTDASDDQMREALAKARSFVLESAEALRAKPAEKVGNG